MKKILLSGLFTLGLLQLGYTQIVGTQAFMKGNYVEVGINGLGGYEGADWDTAAPPLPGMHHRSGGVELFGFVANPQMDAWTNYDGDFYTPGTPENGWGIQIIDNSGAVNITASNNAAWTCEIPGAITSYNYSGGLHTVIWEGDYDSLTYSLHLTIQYDLYDSALAYTTTVTVSNNGDDIDEFYYYRNIDPDNNQSINGNFVTTNTIVSQPSAFSNLAEVSASQTVPWSCVYTLRANDSTARVSMGGFSNRNASEIWNASAATPSYLVLAGSGTFTADMGISLAFKMDSLMAFRSARTVSFDSQFSTSIITGNNEHDNGVASVYPNPTTGVLNISSKETVMGITVYNTIGKLQMQNTNTHNIDLSSLGAGIYLVIIETASGKTTKRIAKE